MRFLLVILSCSILLHCKTAKEKNGLTSLNEIAMSQDEKENKSEQEWKEILTPEQYYILREKGTERPFTGKFNLHKEKGVYVCVGCGNELFSSDAKFDSHCGWPSFFASMDKTKIKTERDTSHGMIRVEIMCARCGGHLGHIFDDGPNPTGLRYCVNSISLDFKKEE
jgi:peptide-methionine (R)-S-oxide reductase